MGILWQVVVWVVLLGITAGLTVAFGPVGFIIGLLLCWIQQSSFRRRQERKEYKELLAAVKNKH